MVWSNGNLSHERRMDTALLIRLIALLVFPAAAFGQAYTWDDLASVKNFKRASTAAAACTAGTNTLAVTLIEAFGNTSNNVVYTLDPFTTATNATYILFVAGTPQLGTESVSNSTTPLAWWQPVTGTNYNVTGTPTARLSAWVAQMPQGQAPFSTSVSVAIASGSGVNMALVQITGASQVITNGTNAIVQAVAYGVNASANPTNQFVAPGNNALNTMLFAVADDVNSASDIAPNQNWTELSETAYNTPATGLEVCYTNNAALMTTVTNTATSRDWATIAIEVRAGTNCQICDFTTAPAFVQGNTTNVAVVGGSSNVFVNLAANMTAGNLSVVSIWQDGVDGTVSTVTNNVGDSYTLITNIDCFSSAHSLYTYYKANVTTGANRVYIRQNTNLLVKIATHEYSGVTTLDTYQIFTQSSQAMASGYVNQTSGRSVLYETFGDSSGFAITPSDGSTTRTTAADERLKTSDRITTCITGAVQATATPANSELWTCAIVVFK